MIKEIDYNYIATNILTTHKTLGQSVSFVQPLVYADNVYDESKYMKFSKPVVLSGLVKYSPTQEELSPVGLDKKANLVVTLCSLEMEEKEILNLKDMEWLKSRFIINEAHFTIVSVRPCNNVLGRPIQYKFECKAVDYYGK